MFCFLIAVASLTAQTRTTSVVRADAQSGRLVRQTVVVAPKVVEPKVVEPVPVGEATPGGADLNDIVEKAAQKHGVDPLLVHSVIRAESNYNPRALSNKGAQGLMQLMPGTARDLGVRNAFDPKDNVEAGVKYLRYLQGVFGDPALALAAYNAGPGAVKRYNNWIPPYRETQDYVVKVAKYYREARGHQKPQVGPPAPTPATPAPPAPPRVEQYTDADGRVYLRTVK